MEFSPKFQNVRKIVEETNNVPNLLTLLENSKFRIPNLVDAVLEAANSDAELLQDNQFVATLVQFAKNNGEISLDFH